jgi:hypothetical protein
MGIVKFRTRALAAGLAAALAAGTPGLAAPVMTNTAAIKTATEADVIRVDGGFAAGLFGGLVGGAIVGAAVARPRYYYPPPYYYDPYYGPPPVVYAEPPVYAAPPPGRIRQCWEPSGGYWRAC